MTGNKMSLKSQSATEFIVLASFMLFVVIGFFAIATSNTTDAREESKKKTSQDIADFAYREIELAKSVNDGYVRNFSMPKNVNGLDYNIGIVDNVELTVQYDGYEYVKFLPLNVIGNISSGLNQIRKVNGIIYITNISSQ